MQMDMRDNLRLKRIEVGCISLILMFELMNVAVCRDAAAQIRGSTQTAKSGDSAKDLIRRGDYEGALRLMEAEYSLNPSLTLTFNIAMCKKALGRHVDAVKSFHQYFQLEAKQSQKDPKTTQLAASALEEELSFVSRLDLVDAPNGSRISIDGVSIGTLPLTEIVYLLPGNHTVTVDKESLSPLEIDVTAVGGAEITVRADLKSAMSRILVTCSVQNGLVSIDGEKCGNCPCETDVAPGPHEVQITAPGKKTAVHQFTAEMRHTTVLSVDLEPIPETRAPKMPTVPLNGPNRNWMKGVGIALTAVGAVGLGVGVFFNYKQISYANDANEEINNPDGNKTSYDSNVNNADRCTNGMIAGYVVGGTLAAAGIVFILLNKKGEGKHDVSLSSAGIEIEF
jgi:hypothetical protein